MERSWDERLTSAQERPVSFWIVSAVSLAAIDILYMLLVWLPLHDKNLSGSDYQIEAQAQNEPGLLHVLGGVLTMALPGVAAPLLGALLVATALTWREASNRDRRLRVLLLVLTLAVFLITWPTWGMSLAWYYG